MAKRDKWGGFFLDPSTFIILPHFLVHVLLPLHRYNSETREPQVAASTSVGCKNPLLSRKCWWFGFLTLWNKQQ